MILSWFITGVLASGVYLAGIFIKFLHVEDEYYVDFLDYLHENIFFCIVAVVLSLFGLLGLIVASCITVWIFITKAFERKND